MKRILIVGQNSYIGTNLQTWLSKSSGNYDIETISVRDNEWRVKNFSQYDSVVHLAGIVHVRETKNNKELYNKVNRDLVYEVAKKSKSEGVSQFIFLSTMSVYGVKTGIITKQTLLKPQNEYGKSKLEAENLISKLSDKNFNVTIIRPPMVYGKECVGNYTKLSRIAKKTPLFPDIHNMRSMIYIENLVQCIKILIDTNKSGVYLPQNKEYVSTSYMVKEISRVHGKNIKLTKSFNFLFRIVKMNFFDKIFGDLVYDMELSKMEIEYRLVNFNESIKRTEL